MTKTTDPLKSDLHKLNLSIKTENALRRANITSIADLFLLGRANVRKRRRIGDTAIAEIEAALAGLYAAVKWTEGGAPPPQLPPAAARVIRALGLGDTPQIRRRLATALNSLPGSQSATLANVICALLGHPVQPPANGTAGEFRAPLYRTRGIVGIGWEPGDGTEPGAQLVDGDWWWPVLGCESLQETVSHVRGLLCSTAAPASHPADGEVAEPESSHIRYEFNIFDVNCGDLQASGEAPTLEEAMREGAHYFAKYSEDEPCRIEICRVKTISVHPHP